MYPPGAPGESGQGREMKRLLELSQASKRMQLGGHLDFSPTIPV